MDERGTLDSTEFLNISKDDALAWPSKVHMEYPSTVNTRMESTIKPFVQKSVDINDTFIDVFNDRLGFPKGTFAKKHPMWEPSCSEARCIRTPPGPNGLDDKKTALGAHTDFGSLVSLIEIVVINSSAHTSCSRSSITDLAAFKLCPPVQLVGTMSRYGLVLCNLVSEVFFTNIWAAYSRSRHLQYRRCPHHL